jgi:hypothetical protein
MNKSDPFPGADSARRVGDSLQSDSGVCAYMANLRRKKFTGVGASEFKGISDNTSLYILAALILLGAAASLF